MWSRAIGRCCLALRSKQVQQLIPGIGERLAGIGVSTWVRMHRQIARDRPPATGLRAQSQIAPLGIGEVASDSAARGARIEERGIHVAAGYCQRHVDAALLN